MAEGKSGLSAGRLVFGLVYVLLWPALLLWLSGDWLWPEGWLFGGWFVALCAASVVYLYRKDPGLLAERFRPPGTGGQAAWDRPIVGAIVVGFIAWIAVMPLDAKRFGWSAPFPLWLKAAGGLLLLLSSFLLYRSYTDNPYLSPLVRVQADRGQRVVSTGVYGLVRHPMYLGAVLLFVGTPLLLGSWYGMVLGVMLSGVLAGRAVGEERLLAAELEGYAEYRRRVRYRLIPFVW